MEYVDFMATNITWMAVNYRQNISIPISISLWHSEANGEKSFPSFIKNEK